MRNCGLTLHSLTDKATAIYEISTEVEVQSPERALVNPNPIFGR